MSITKTYNKQLDVALVEFGHLVIDGEIIVTPGGIPQKLRLRLIDSSIIDIYLSPRGRYSYHWERRFIDGTIYRHDNAPHNRWQHIQTYPKHFHKGSERGDDVIKSELPEEPIEAVREFLQFVDKKIKSL